MSQETQEVEMATKPVKEHEWLRKLIGEWKLENEMVMGPGGPTVKSQGKESVRDLGGLWAIAEGETAMPNGASMKYQAALGYDVTFKKYRGFWMANVSSHLWVQEGELNATGNVLTLDCVGPNMMGEGTANYRFEFQIIDENHRVMREYGQDPSGTYQLFLTVNYTRA